MIIWARWAFGNNRYIQFILGMNDHVDESV